MLRCHCQGCLLLLPGVIWPWSHIAVLFGFTAPTPMVVNTQVVGPEWASCLWVSVDTNITGLTEWPDEAAIKAWPFLDPLCTTHVGLGLHGSTRCDQHCDCSSARCSICAKGSAPLV